MGVRTVRTPEKEERLLEALREKPSYAAACRKARITRSLFYEWRAEDAEFERRIIEARNQGLDALEDALATRAVKNDTVAAIFLLKSHRREIYGEKIAVDHRGHIRHTVSAPDLTVLTDDELDRLEALALKLIPETVDA